MTIKASILCFSLLFYSFQCFSQETLTEQTSKIPHVTVSIPEYRILYSNYLNHIDINGLNGMGDLEYELENLTIEPDTTYKNCVAVRTTEGAQQAKIRFLKKNDHSLVNELTFQIRHLPLPSLLFNIGALRLQVGYPPEIPLYSDKVGYTVSQWEINVSDGKKVENEKGVGNTLSQVAMSIINRCPANSKITINVTFSGGGYVNKQISRSFIK